MMKRVPLLLVPLAGHTVAQSDDDPKGCDYYSHPWQCAPLSYGIDGGRPSFHTTRKLASQVSKTRAPGILAPRGWGLGPLALHAARGRSAQLRQNPQLTICANLGRIPI
jgi:hypothetical protein